MHCVSPSLSLWFEPVRFSLCPHNFKPKIAANINWAWMILPFAALLFQTISICYVMFDARFIFYAFEALHTSCMRSMLSMLCSIALILLVSLKLSRHDLHLLDALNTFLYFDCFSCYQYFHWLFCFPNFNFSHSASNSLHFLRSA